MRRGYQSAIALPADITLNDVLIGLLEAQDFPWEAVDLVTSGIQEAASRRVEHNSSPSPNSLAKPRFTTLDADAPRTP